MLSHKVGPLHFESCMRTITYSGPNELQLISVLTEDPDFIFQDRVFGVYIRVRIVSTTLTSSAFVAGDGGSTTPTVGMLPATLVSVDGGGVGGSTKPPVGILPAKIGVDTTHMSASASANRFMDLLL